MVATPEFIHLLYEPKDLTIACPNRDRIYPIINTCFFFYRRFRPEIARTSFVDHLAVTARDARKTVNQGSANEAEFEKRGVSGPFADELRSWLAKAKVRLYPFYIRLTIEGKARLATIPFKPEVALFYLDGYLSPAFDGEGKAREFRVADGTFGWADRVHSALFPLSQVEERLRHLMERRPGEGSDFALDAHDHPRQAGIVRDLFRSLSDYESKLEECQILVGPFHPFCKAPRNSGNPAEGYAMDSTLPLTHLEEVQISSEGKILKEGIVSDEEKNSIEFVYQHFNRLRRAVGETPFKVKFVRFKDFRPHGDSHILEKYKYSDYDQEMGKGKTPI
ncbi:hypothetical protein PG993_009157 [Apiospora rasikravindrae]|uniref:Uncharacterized protein n=1 Tax=Apiospora rasikravindrae TaxID=990691 RepID=A0ABR1SJ24_9PEZI